jgi:hypothetical protein
MDFEHRSFPDTEWHPLPSSARISSLRMEAWEHQTISRKHIPGIRASCQTERSCSGSMRQTSPRSTWNALEIKDDPQNCWPFLQSCGLATIRRLRVGSSGEMKVINRFRRDQGHQSVQEKATSWLAKNLKKSACGSKRIDIWVRLLFCRNVQSRVYRLGWWFLAEG